MKLESVRSRMKTSGPIEPRALRPATSPAASRNCSLTNLKLLPSSTRRLFRRLLRRSKYLGLRKRGASQKGTFYFFSFLRGRRCDSRNKQRAACVCRSPFNQAVGLADAADRNEGLAFPHPSTAFPKMTRASAPPCGPEAISHELGFGPGTVAGPSDNDWASSNNL